MFYKSIGLIFLFLLSSSLFSVHAQVNINSKTDVNDKQFFELSDTETITVYEEVFITETPTEIIELPETGTTPDSSNEIIYTIEEGIQGIEENIINSQIVPQFVKNIVTTVGLPTTSAIGSLIPLLPAILTFLPLLFSPQLFLLILGAIFGEQKNIWGIVTDKKSKKPIPFAVIRLYEKNSTAIIAQKVSDLEGRYGFVLSNGEYRLEAEQTGYKLFTKNIVVSSKEELFAEDIQLQTETTNSLKKVLANFYLILKKFAYKYSIYFVVLGLIFSVLALVIEGSALSAFLTVFYLATLLLYIYLKTKNNRTWGVLIDSKSGLKISGATIRLFDTKNSLADTQLSDNQGRFGFLVDPGEYSLLVSMQNYIFPSKTQKDLDVDTNNKNLLNIKTTKARWLNLELKLDPIEGKTKKSNNYLNSPFSDK